MGSACIITDHIAQFTNRKFIGNHLIKFLNSPQESYYSLPGVKQSSTEPTSIQTTSDLHQIFDLLVSVYQSFDDVFVLSSSRHLSSTYSKVETVIEKMHGRAVIHLIDTQTFSIGQGQLVQLAAKLITSNLPGNEVESMIRNTIPRIYTVLCTPNLSNLNSSGFIDTGQAVVGEMASLLPVFTLEEGKINPLEKMKNSRSVIEYFLEFIDEFENLEIVSFLQPVQSAFSESKLIKQHIEEFFPETSFSEFTLDSFLSGVIGQKGFGIVIAEKSH